MKSIQYLLIIPFILLFSCNVEQESGENHNITATINGETWYFYNVSTGPTTEGNSRLIAQGYLKGNQGAEPANLEIVFVGIPDLATAGEGYTADFSPSSAGTSAYATLTFPDQGRTFDTKLDPETTGTFTIEEIENNTMSGNFKFKAKDQLGNLVTIESADFENVNLAQNQQQQIPESQQ